jgi:hypothetical protein
VHHYLVLNMNYSASIHIVAVDDPTSDFILRKLSLLARDSVKIPRSNATTHIVVVYDINDIVGGAIIRCSPEMVIVKQMCTSNDEHSKSVVKFLRCEFDNIEIHLNVLCTTMHLYKDLDFVKRYRTKCKCGRTNNISHMTWVPRALLKGIILYINPIEFPLILLYFTVGKVQTTDSTVSTESTDATVSKESTDSTNLVPSSKKRAFLEVIVSEIGNWLILTLRRIS